jgi:acyl dehydratase
MSMKPWSSWELGDRLPSLEIGPLSRTDIVRYAGASGDFARMHHDEPYAVSLGHPSVFAMGLYPAGILTRLVSENFDLAKLRAFRVRFQSMTWPGDVLVFSGKVSDKRENANGRVLTVTTIVSSAENDVKITGSFEVAFE